MNRLNTRAGRRRGAAAAAASAATVAPARIAAALAAASLATALLAAAPAAAADKPQAARPAGAPACDAGAPLPLRFRLDYAAHATRGPFKLDGSSELAFAVEGRSYTLRSRTRSALFSADQASSGELRGALLVPHSFVEKNARRQRRADFDWAQGRVAFSANPEQPAAVLPLLQDRLSLLLQAGQQLRAQRGEGPVVLPVAGQRRISSYRLALAGRETLALAAGRFETLHLRRPLDDEHDGVDLWIAPALCWLPVQIRYTDEHGTVIQNRLRAAVFD